MNTTITDRDVFEHVRQHLINQGQRSIDPMIGCSYRSPDGLMCAVGCLIPAEEYRDHFEGVNACDDGVRGALRLNGLPLFGESDFDGDMDSRTVMLNSLQLMHDTRKVVEWPRLLRTFAFTTDGQYLHGSAAVHKR